MPTCSIPGRTPTTSPGHCWAVSAPASCCSPGVLRAPRPSPRRVRPAPFPVRSRWWTRSARVTPSWPPPWRSCGISTPSGTLDRVCLSSRRRLRGCCAERWRWPRSRVSDAERTHLDVWSCLAGGPPDLLPAQCGQHVVHHDRVHGHAAVAGWHLDLVGGGVQARPPVDDAVTLAVDRGEGELGVERLLALLPRHPGALAAEAVGAHHSAEAGAGELRQHLGVPGEHLVDGTGCQHGTAHADDSLDQVGSTRGETAGQHAAKAVTDDGDLAVAPGRDRLQSHLEVVGGLPGAAR